MQQQLPMQGKMILFFFNDTATTEIYTLSLHDALPILPAHRAVRPGTRRLGAALPAAGRRPVRVHVRARSEEHTSELQSRQYLVCRLLLEKKQNSFLITTSTSLPASLTILLYLLLLYTP